MREKENSGNTLNFKILLAEDNELNQRLTKLLLEEMQFECDVAENGKVALEMLKKNKYNLLLLDMQMPIMDGEETIEHIRKDNILKNLYVIAMTAHAMKGDAEKYIDLGCNGCMSKPIDKDKLEGMLNMVFKKLN